MGKIESDIAEYVGNHSFRKTVDNHSLQTGRETEINHQSGLLYPARQGSVLLAVWPASAGKQRVLLTLYSDRSARGDHQSRPQVSCRERVGGQRRVLPGAAGAAGRAADPDQRRRAGRDPEAGCEDRGD